MTFRFSAIVAAATTALLVPGAAQAAATQEVYMGTPTAAQKSFQPSGGDVHSFFPQAITIHTGDSVRFIPSGFHTVDLPASGGKGQAIIVPIAGKNVAGEADAAGAPFWFNGLPALGLNPTLLASNLGKKLSYSGAARVDSGLPLAAKPKAMTVRFTKSGSFTYYCDVHIGMKGTVKVVAKSKPVLSDSANEARVAKQVKVALATAKKLATTTAPPDTVDVGAHGAHGVEIMGFLPRKLTVPVGTTVRFTMAPGSVEDHTATTGPGDPEHAPSSYLGKVAAGLNAPVFPGQSIYPSELLGTAPAQLTPALHGNGFWSSGAMDANPTTILPNASTVTFAAPGQYEFYCMIHPFMHGTVVVG